MSGQLKMVVGGLIVLGVMWAVFLVMVTVGGWR